MASVASKNPFALLEDDGDETSPAPAPASKAAAAATAPSSKKQPANRGGPGSRGGKYYSRGGARPSGDGNLNQDGLQEPVDSGRRSDRGRGRGGRGGRGRGGGGGGGGRMDRHSGTGKSDSDKKVHQGWGGDEGSSELKVEEAAATDAAFEAGAGDWGAPSGDASGWDAPAASFDTPDAPAEDKPARKEREPREPEPEDNSLTLDQYLAQQKEKEADAVPKLESARAVKADWKDVKPLEKDEEDAYFVGKTKSAPKARAQQAPKENIEVGFSPPAREGGRGRGRGRGGNDRGDRGSRGGNRGGRGGRRGAPNGSAPDVGDTNAFPSLS